MRIRNKLLVAISVPVGLLVVQVASVNYFVRELQSAVSFIASAHATIEADFVAAELVGRLRQEVKRLPSAHVVAPSGTADDRHALRAAWNELTGKMAFIDASPAVREIDPRAAAIVDAAFGRAKREYDRVEKAVADGPTDFNRSIELAVFADTALAELAEALNGLAVELRKELQAAVDRERAVHDRPIIAGVAIGAAAVVLLLAFAWLYVDRRLAARLTALSRSMRAIADGDLAAPLPARGGNDEIVGMVDALTVFRDTAREVEEQNLRERQVVLDTIEYGVLILDPSLRLRMHNRAFRDLWGVSEAGLRAGSSMRSLLKSFGGRRLHGVPEAEWSAYVDRRMAEIRAADTPPQEWLRPDGRVLQYEIAALPDGGRMLTYFDLTELKRVEVELRAAKEQAELASHAKSDFLASMSHELRTPLNAIIGITEMLKEDAEADGDAAQEESLARVLRAGKLLLQLINEILDLAKIEAGKLELRSEDLELRALVADVLETAQPLAEKRANRLVLEADGELGRVSADPMRLRQILLNLLSNACKFTERGSVTLAARREGERITLAVRDTGIGIEAEQLPRLFEEFHQAGAAKHRKYGGTGLGLAISRRLVTLMGGEIAAASEAGVGSVFTVTLPARAPARVEAA